LLLEGVAGILPEMISLLSRHPDATLELRTKGAAIDPLAAAGAAANVIVSWTFSPEEVVREFEPGTASASARIEAAARLQQAGFSIGVRLDPIILRGDWLGAYGRLVSLICEKLDPTAVDSVHLGALRFTPAVKQAVLVRHGSSAPFDGEFLMCGDGKMRYPRPLRAAAYTAIGGMFSDCGWGVPISLFMETRSVRREVRL
ncbi:MAG: hypothetical protein QGD94_12135, partial [Planctomycetia bacterium]|nr:hypothetical protein [Planctomycetia bacterium]